MSSRQQQLEEWKARKAAERAAVGGPTGARLPAVAGAKPPLAGLVPRPPKGAAAADKENSGTRTGALGGGVPRPADSSMRKAALPDSQKRAMESTFDSLQERMKALKRESLRPALGGAASAASTATQAPEPLPLAPLPSARLHAAENQAACGQLPVPAAAAAAPAAAAPVLKAAPVVVSAPVPAAPATASAPVSTAPQPAATPVPPAPAPVPAELGGFGGIAARLESLKRESLRPSIAGGGLCAAAAAPGVQFESGGQFDGQALTKLALGLFEDEGFRGLCDKGLSAQLTRSRDGATEETKIQELAGIVKLLRRGMKELQGRAGEYVAAACKFEREAVQQVESVKLSAESERMHLAAEMARLRSEMAGLAADHKAERSRWQEALAAQQARRRARGRGGGGDAGPCRRGGRGPTSGGRRGRLAGHEQRYKLEADRLEGEKGALQERLRRAEGSKAEVEEQLRRALKELNSDLSRLKADTNKEAEERYTAAQAAERRQAVLAEALGAAEARAGELADANEGLQRQARGRGARVESLQRSSAKLERQLADLREQHAALQAEHEQLHAEFREHRQAHEKLVADSASALRELEEAQEELGRSAASLKAECAAHLATRQQLTALGQSRGEEQAAWAAQRAVAAADAAAAAERERGLAAECARADAELAAARAKCGEYEGMMAAAATEIEQLRAAAAARDAASREAEAAAADARARAAAAEAALEEEARARGAARREAAEQAEKLAQLEAELEALQECTIGLGSGDQKEMLSRMVSRIAALEAAVVAAEARRREIHNQLVELKGNIRVFCRIRPNPRSVVHCLPDGVGVRISGPDGKDHLFAFDRVFGPEAGQAAVFDEVSDLVQSALDGFKVCLFSYGQTGAGKTHTMQGSRSGEGQGIIPRAAVARLREQGWEYRLEGSFVEVYNESLRDLLAEPGPGARARDAGRLPDANAIQHGSGGGHTVVAGAARLTVESEEDAAALVRRAAAARAVEATAMNATSSRSHSVFMLYVTGRHEASGTLLQARGERGPGSLNLVDLAGSERLARSQAEGARAKEACNINKSLSSLGDVFQALAAKAPHVPYRNSKLTHLLQPCLGGSGKTLMFVNVNPEPESAQESLCSLRFAAKVNACETAAKGGAHRHVSLLEAGGRPSVAPGDLEARRMSVAPGAAAGLKRKAGLPSAGPSRGIPRPRLG
eukprot:scaffold6.g2597.t1